MAERKFADEEVIKALECCIQNSECEHCEYREKTDKNDICPIRADALNLINKQKQNLEQCENGYSQELHLARCQLADAKSELEQLQHKYDLAVAEREANVKGFTEELEKANAEIDRLKYNLKAVLDEIPETKRELVSEIFADFTKHKVCTNEEDFRVLAELKKKYIGEKENDR